MADKKEKKEKKESHVRRDHLREIERRMQQFWEASRCFQADAPTEEGTAARERFLATFPYPYMNGRLHLGHSFTLTKAEFACHFERLRGKHVLFPFGFHCTGMPIKACADKLAREVEEIGIPELIRLDLELQEQQRAAAAEAALKKSGDGGSQKPKGAKPKPPKQPAGGKGKAAAASATATATTASAKSSSAPSSASTTPTTATTQHTATTASTTTTPAATSTAAAAASTTAAVQQSTVKQPPKVAAKTGAGTQFSIMRANGVPIPEIPEFRDPYKWVRYFPPLAEMDLKVMGCGVDWRRSFITTDANPYYDGFIRWQFNVLHKLGKIDFGKRYTVYSAKDQQPCADHERASGEGVGPQEYTIIKLRVKMDLVDRECKFSTHAMRDGRTIAATAGSRPVFLIAATLRPETMYGQTNCWVLPRGDYSVVEHGGELLITSAWAARNLSFQLNDHTDPAFGVVNTLSEIQGWDLLGLPLSAPLSVYETVYTLPMLTIDMEKTTGIVTSVPSDAPDDFMALKDLRDSTPEAIANRAKYHLKDEWVLPFAPVPIIRTPLYGDSAADRVCMEPWIVTCADDPAAATGSAMRPIANQHDVRLPLLKKAVYKQGFYHGTMLIGPYSGRPVKDVKTVVANELVAAGLAMRYAEPKKRVMSRSGDRCVVALCDQWYLKYGETNWRTETETCLNGVTTYHTETRRVFEKALNWLNQWGCSRSFGLGTRIPWDPQYLIESLSDSTIYMAYYTVAHLLQGDISGQTPGLLGITPAQMTDEVWDYVLRGAAAPSPCDIPLEKLQRMRREFTYWYPVSLRVSGKDLIRNHLTFFMYIHTAIWPDQAQKDRHWPKGIRCNGHLLLDGEKMSKQTGNFITLAQGVEMFGADAMRFALANAGDSVDDSNFESAVANSAVLRLTNEDKFVRDIFALRAYPEGTVVDSPESFAARLFRSEINLCIRDAIEAYDKMMYREVLRVIIDMQNARDTYRNMVVCLQSDMKCDLNLLRLYAETEVKLLAPICPHLCEDLWLSQFPPEARNASHSVLFSGLPACGPIDEVLLKAGKYLEKILYDFRQLRDQRPRAARRAGPAATNPDIGAVYYATTFPDWHTAVVSALTENWRPDVRKFADDTRKALSRVPVIQANSKKAMSFAATLMTEVERVGNMQPLSVVLPFNEVEVLQGNEAYIRASLGLTRVSIRHMDEAPGDQRVQLCLPGAPQVVFSFSTGEPS
eukprot:gnl/Spiro4/9718_TR5168_c0_g1_i1.p1 gnl/Spiro4/9718_TR5168_c0_g1~~gnl/Spiro4/9718_TR5168_c0_g1_i1.p1  ORF type:complete len:1216 (-),score=352.15 gnl/Spiro4/9718_TR5168_c0_g1_i1:52-3699(-)